MTTTADVTLEELLASYGRAALALADGDVQAAAEVETLEAAIATKRAAAEVSAARVVAAEAERERVRAEAELAAATAAKVGAGLELDRFLHREAELASEIGGSETTLDMALLDELKAVGVEISRRLHLVGIAPHTQASSATGAVQRFVMARTARSLAAFTPGAYEAQRMFAEPGALARHFEGLRHNARQGVADLLADPGGAVRADREQARAQAEAAAANERALAAIRAEMPRRRPSPFGAVPADGVRTREPSKAELEAVERERRAKVVEQDQQSRRLHLAAQSILSGQRIPGVTEEELEAARAMLEEASGAV